MKPNIVIEDGFIAEHETLFQALMETVQWNHILAARCTASFGVPYNYSGITYPVVPMHSALVLVADKLHARFGIGFNNCLLNYYEDGRKTMGFHSDDTTNLQPGTGVAIVSLGHARDITYRHKVHREIQQSYTLLPGSLLYMDDVVQSEWRHAIKKQAEAGPRISSTWRAVEKVVGLI